MNPRSGAELDDPPAGGQAVQVERALDALEWLAGTSAPGRGLSELAAGLEQPKATVHRLMTVLRRRGYVTQDGQARYRLGIKCYELGERWSQSFDLRAFAHPYLQRLNNELGESVNLAVYQQGDAVYVDKMESTLGVIARPNLGNRVPATVVASGRALLAFQPQEEINAQLARPLPAYTEETPTTPAAVSFCLEQVRVDGYAVNRETYRRDVCGVAAPVRDSTGAVIACVGMVVPAHRFNGEWFEVRRDAVVRTALEITGALGGPAQLVTTGG